MSHPVNDTIYDDLADNLEILVFEGTITPEEAEELKKLDLETLRQKITELMK
jgi:uncharacterized protein YutE (UPF0331/DUF86 family)